MIKNVRQNINAQVDPQDHANSIKQNILSKDSRDPRIMAAAKLYEEQFLREMVGAMRKAVPKSELTKESMGEKIFSDQLYDQYVEQWSNVGGVGLSNMIYDQIMERFGSQKKIERPSGPISTENHKTFQIENRNQESGGQNGAMLLQVSPQKNADDTHILMPWKGKVTAMQSLESGERAVFVQHDNGLKSTFLFRGQLAENKKELGPGESLVQLNGVDRSFIWRLENG